MVNPDVFAFHQLDIVASTDVVGSGTQECQIAEDAVLPVLTVEETSIVGIVVVVAVIQGRTREAVVYTLLYSPSYVAKDGHSSHITPLMQYM